MGAVSTGPAATLRLWPGVVIVALQWLARFGLPIFDPEWMMYAVMAGFAGGVALVIWWLFFSRAPWLDRLAGIAVMVVSMAATWPFLDRSLATGAMGMLFPMLAMPGLCLAFVLALVATRQSSPAVRRTVVALAVLVASAGWSLIKTGGFTGSFDNDLSWRWTPTAEERVLALGDDTPPAPPADRAVAPVAVPAPAAPIPAPSNATPTAITAAVSEGDVADTSRDWPGFRGRDRDSIVRGVHIATDWSAAPPKELWRRPIGPGWSSFAVHGDVFYTQEQRGEDEIVAAYRVSTGAPVWKHRDAARFWESNGGPGPRGTPTFSEGRLYTFGATGILNVLDAATGRAIWTRNVAADANEAVPAWGFSSSPLLVDDLVVVATAGKLVAYDRATGAPRWTGPDGGEGYSSPHLMTIGGVRQIVLLDQKGATGVSIPDGSRLWDVTLTTSGMSAPIVQPAMIGGDVLIGSGDLTGMRRFTVSNTASGWSATERWSTNGLKPYYNDFVVHKGHAYGFDGAMLACIDLADGRRTWKGGRYGNGQLILLADQDLLLVLSEEGELVLVSAATDKFTEVAKVPAIQGKTWNHPVLAGDILLVRNGEEMAAFRLAADDPGTTARR